MTSEHDTFPDNVSEIGYIRISVFMGPEGLGTGFNIDGISPEAAIGHMVVVTDRLREDRALSWAEEDIVIEGFECPNCGASFGCDHEDGEDG